MPPRLLTTLGLALLLAQASAASAQSFVAPGGVGPSYGAFPGGGASTGSATFVGPNSFAFSSYGGIGPFGGPAFGRVLAGTNVVGYSNNAYSSFSGQYGGLGVPVFSNRVGGYSARSSGVSFGNGGVAVYGVGDSFGYAQPGLVPGLSGSYPFGGGAVSHPLGAYGGSRSGTMTYLPIGGY